MLACLLGLALGARTFAVSGNNFVKDGQNYRYVSGSYHYFRDEPELWEDRIRKMAAGGLNAVQTYVAWNLHEPTPGAFTFSGRCDIERFLDLCSRYNLTVILRPGPYICAEWAIGGFPYWLFKVPGIAGAFRTSSAVYMDHVTRWLTALYTRLAPKMYARGGPIILVQVENEYGSFGCDHAYMNALADLAKKHLGQETVLITADNPDQTKLNCGSLPTRAVVTLNYGSKEDPRPHFAMARTTMGGSGPYVTSEYWTDYGSSDWVIPQWGRAFPRRTGDEIATWLDRQLQLGASVNMYMYYGGSNWVYAGAGGTTEFSGTFEPCLTSYDYDAPLTEAGDVTDKYTKVRTVIAKYLTVPTISVKDFAKKSYGQVHFTQSVPLAAAPEVIEKAVDSDDPKTFEDLDCPFGFVLYETNATIAGALTAHVFDHAVLSVNGAATSAKAFRPKALTATVKVGDRLAILVEQLGRFNFGKSMLADKKGLRQITIGGTAVKKWRQRLIPLDTFKYDLKWETKLSVGAPTFYRASFDVDEPADTFFNPTGLDCGIAFVNGVHIGHYWRIGPQTTLYVRAQYLKKGVNELVVFETGSITAVPTVTFDAKANIDAKATPIANA
jgi:beta-galactosidase